MDTRSKRSHDDLIAEDANLLDEASSRSQRKGKNAKPNGKIFIFSFEFLNFHQPKNRNYYRNFSMEDTSRSSRPRARKLKQFVRHVERIERVI